jgi:hypothetical protein
MFIIQYNDMDDMNKLTKKFRTLKQIKNDYFVSLFLISSKNKNNL